MTREAYRARRHAMAQANYAATTGVLRRYEWRQEQIQSGRHAAKERERYAKKKADFAALRLQG